MNHITGTPSRPGPEADLVQHFVDTDLPPAQKGESRLVFIEPQVEASRPDIVVVYWDSSTAESWPQERSNLKRRDLRLAHFLYLNGPIAEGDVRPVFPRGLARSLERLEHAGLSLQRNGLWTLRRIPSIFAVCRIIAFEAKISSLSRALEQAHRNTWFASESYILTTVKQPRTEIVDRARQLGVGLWLADANSTSQPLLYAEKHKIPLSPGSWLFNELVWRQSLGVS